MTFKSGRQRRFVMMKLNSRQPKNIKFSSRIGRDKTFKNKREVNLEIRKKQ